MVRRWSTLVLLPLLALPAQAMDAPKAEGDYVLLELVESYDRRTGILTTIEGNTSHRVRRKTYDLNRDSVRTKIDGFGRPALGDFSSRR